MWHKYGGAELEEHFAYTAPIDAAWLLKLALGEVMPESKGVVPAWQQVPPEAKVNLDDLRHTTITTYLPVLVLSYGWRAKHHPDPKGEMLRELIPLLRTLVESCTKGMDPYDPEYRPRVWGVLWEYAPARPKPRGRVRSCAKGAAVASAAPCARPREAKSRRSWPAQEAAARRLHGSRPRRS